MGCSSAEKREELDKVEKIATNADLWRTRKDPTGCEDNNFSAASRGVVREWVNKVMFSEELLGGGGGNKPTLQLSYSFFCSTSFCTFRPVLAYLPLSISCLSTRFLHYERWYVNLGIGGGGQQLL